MDDKRFSRLIREARGYPSDYTRGYVRGLRRLHHGAAFGTDEEHARFLAMRDGARAAIGIGYAHGLAGSDPIWRADLDGVDTVRDLCDLVGGQNEAARILGVADRTVRRWCAGTGSPATEMLERLRDESVGCA